MKDIRKLTDSFDVVMFPVDGRIGNGYTRGARQFLDVFRTGLFVPMHFVASGFESAWRMKEFTDAKSVPFWCIHREGKDKAVLSCAVTGASVCVIINLLIVGQLASVGSAIAWVMAECSVLLVSAFWVYRYLSVTFPVKLFLKNLFFSLPYLILGLVIIYVIDNLWWRLLMGACFYLVYAYILEEKLLKLGIVSNLISMINHKNR